MVARKRMTRPILTINSEIVEERILGDQGPRILTYNTMLHRIPFNDLLCHLRKTNTRELTRFVFVLLQVAT